jgi:3'-phosphoadenosine 5'-phosphosulfate sulfotransferase (PAPS reductase)/FAD synthetase
VSKVRHVLGISGGKDSAALAIYLKNLYPKMDIDYYSSDTGKELDETYELVSKLEGYLGRKIQILKAAENSHVDSFDHFLKLYGGFLPSSNSRWCTKKLKLEPFEKYVGSEPVVSYVGIRGDEDREGYISRKSNIQSIFPFRRNIWSEDVITKFLTNSNMPKIVKLLKDVDLRGKEQRIREILETPIGPGYQMHSKLNGLLDLGIKETNQLVFNYLKDTTYPLALEDEFPLINNEENLNRADIFKLLEESGVGIPAYYNAIKFNVNGTSGEYARSRSGCYFCFFQQKIEWVWLYEQHPDMYAKAMEYEKDGYTWMQEESLAELISPARMEQIKSDYIKRKERMSNQKSNLLLDILDESETEGCAACFI